MPQCPRPPLFGPDNATQFQSTIEGGPSNVLAVAHSEKRMANSGSAKHMSGVTPLFRIRRYCRPFVVLKEFRRERGGDVLEVSRRRRKVEEVRQVVRP